MTTQTVTTIPAPRTAVADEIETVACCFDLEPIALDDLREHADACGECFAYHVQEN